VLASSLPQLFQQALDQGDASPIEREAIERAIVAGRIDAADYEAAHVRYMQCMMSNGIEPQIRKTPAGYYIEEGWDSNRTDAMDVHWRCLADNALIDQLYRIQQANPGLLADQRLVAIQCLRREGLVDADYTVDDFDRDLGDMSKPTFPFDIYAESANNCLFFAGYAFYTMS